MELLQAVVMEQLYLPLPSYNTIQTAGFLWLLTFNSLGTHLEMSNCRQIVFECLRSCLPCCPLQSKCMGFRVHNQMAVNELQIWWEHCVAMRSFQPFPTPSSKFVTLLTLIAFNCNFKKCFCWLFHYIYIFFSQPKHVFKSCKPLQEEMPVLHVKYIYTTAPHLSKRKFIFNSTFSWPAYQVHLRARETDAAPCGSQAAARMAFSFLSSGEKKEQQQNDQNDDRIHPSYHVDIL